MNMYGRVRRAATVACAAGWAATAAAGSAGTSGGAALSLGGSARALGLGGAGTAALAEASAIWVNPALLARLDAPQLSFMHGMYVGDVSVEQLAVAGPTPLPGRFGGALTALRVGAIDGYDSAGTATGSYTPRELAVTGGWAMSHGLVAAGAAATWMSSELAAGVNATAFAGDVGVTVSPTPMVVVGAAVQHLGSSLGYGGTSAKLPMTIRGGGAWSGPVGRATVTVAAEGVKPADGNVSARAGLEGGMPVTPDVTASARAGYATATPRGGLSGVTVGAGVLWRPEALTDSALPAADGSNRWDVRGVRVDYAWTPLGELGSAHWFSVALAF